MSATAAPTTQTKTAPVKPRRSLGDLKIALLFIAPALLGFCVFFVWPTIRGIYLSFTNFDGSNRTPGWVGLANYKQMLSDPVLGKSLLATLEYVVINIVVQTILAILIAVLMQRVAKSTLARGILLLPYFIANVIVALVWFWMLDPNLGIVNDLIEKVGLDGQSWFGNGSLVIPTIALINVWRYMGYTALLIFAGLQTIPSSVYEAASLDGAGELKQFFTITLPLLRPVLVLVLITSVVGSFQVFDTVAVTTRGGPANASNVIQYYIVDQAFNRSHFGYGAAISVLLFVILIVVALVQFKVLRGRESDLA
ncbi:sugar ABC transporter permease [Nakamurella flava]|uniref:Sugar ABC transporter permease n=1 Tax=Nakamurella flava TaxID=2576308 RepID=A0A4U6QCT2_9ACTN|nr:sugar ABC transporter permease [Nakamurella flava]TKV57831.1 sugar ABC transporter permease [Nakamurella flava]